MTQTDRGDFADFTRRHGDRMLRLGWLVTRNADDARDAVQDALLGLMKRWPDIPDGPAEDAYVRRSVVNASLAIIGRRTPSGTDVELETLPARDDPAHLVAATDSAWRLIGSLPPIQRAAVALRFVDDLDYAGIAAVLGCKESTARSHVHRALGQLRANPQEMP